MRAKVNVVVGRGSNGRYSMRIEDAVSGLRVVEIDLTGEQLAAAVTGLYTSDVEADLFPEGADRWGRMESEHRKFELPVESDNWSDQQDKVEAMLAPEGWILQREGRRNMHRVRPGNRYVFHAFRWVPAEAVPASPEVE